MRDRVIFIFYFVIYSINCEKILDLTWPYSNNSLSWPGSQPFKFIKMTDNSDGKKPYWYAANDFETGEHSGTHFDAPYHFFKKGWKVGDIPIERLFTNGVLCDMTNKIKAEGSNFLLNGTHLDQWKNDNKIEFSKNTVVLIKFGWSQFWPNRAKYYGIDSNGTFHFPGVSESAAHWFANTKNIVGVGVDTASVDPGTSTDFKTHQVHAEASMYNLENVKITEDLPTTGFKLIVAPMKIQDGTGAPARIFAVLKENDTFCHKNR